MLTSSDASFLKTTKVYTYFKLHNSLKNVCPRQTQKSFIIKFLPLYIFSTVMSEVSTHIFLIKMLKLAPICSLCVVLYQMKLFNCLIRKQFLLTVWSMCNATYAHSVMCNSVDCRVYDLTSPDVLQQMGYTTAEKSRSII